MGARDNRARLAPTEIWILTNFPSPSGRGQRVRALGEGMGMRGVSDSKVVRNTREERPTLSPSLSLRERGSW